MRAGSAQVVGEVEEALEEPGLMIEAVVTEDGLGPSRAGKGPDTSPATPPLSNRRRVSMIAIVAALPADIRFYACVGEADEAGNGDRRATRNTFAFCYIVDGRQRLSEDA